MLSMSLSLLARDSLEITHVGSGDRRPDHSQVINLGHFISSLVVFEEELQILNVLKLDKFQRYW